MEGRGAPFHVTQGLSPNSLGQTNAMSFCLERPVCCGHGNAPASDDARMVHFVLLLRKAKPVGSRQPTCLVERLNRRVFHSSRECLEPSPLRRFGGHVRSHTNSSGPSLLGRCLDHRSCFLYVNVFFLATLRMCTIFHSLACLRSRIRLDSHAPGWSGGLPPWYLGYPLRQSTTHILGRPMGSHQPIMPGLIHADAHSGNICLSIVPTAEVTLQSRGCHHPLGGSVVFR